MLEPEQNPLETLVFALEKYPDEVEMIHVDEILLDSARGNAKRPAYVKLAVPDASVKALRGSAERRPEDLYLVRMPRRIKERSESPIILPGEV